MKKSYFIRTFAILVLVGASIFAINSCKKNVGPTDLLADPIIVPKSTLEISVLDATSKDSMAGFTIAVTDPAGKLTTATVDKKYTFNNVTLSGNYTVIVSKTGFITENKVINVALVANSSMFIPSSILLAKAAAPVVVDSKLGGQIQIAADLNNTTAKPAAKLGMDPGTEVKLNGVVVASPSIAATYVPSSSFVDKSGAMTATDLPTTGSVPLKSMNFQPDGMTFSKPLKISLYVGDVLAGLTGTELDEAKAGITFDNVHSDGTVEAIPVKSFNAAGDTAYFFISHFSTWELKLPINAVVQTKTFGSWRSLKFANCNAPAEEEDIEEYIEENAPMFVKVMGWGGASRYYFPMRTHISKLAIPGFKWNIKWRSEYITYKLKKKSTGAVAPRIYKVATNVGEIVYDFTSCHNQGGN